MSHMTLDDRVSIQEGLDNNLSPSAISKKIGKARSTVIREITKRRAYKGKRYPGAKPPCVRKKDCVVFGLCNNKRCSSPCRNCHACKDICPEYFPNECERLSKSPHVCNGCIKAPSCNYDRYYYYASYAHNSYQDILISTREGINQDPESLQLLDDIISPLIRKGQSLSHIFANHADEIGCSRSTVYRYLNDSVLTARNIDLPRRVKYKARKTSNGNKLTKEEKLMVLSRSYERFKKYMEQNPDTEVVEMDTVVGPISTSKVLLTLLFRSCNLMLVFLLKQKTQKEVIYALNWLCDELGIELFKQLFPVILTDRGTEFLNPEAIECDRYGEIKTKLFYCDPQCAWQKGALEKNHEFIRYIVPKGTSFDDLTQADITLITNHINSLARDKYHGKTPYQLSKVLIDNRLHEIMKLVEIKPDEVFLKPALIKRQRR
ncbi:Transposase and inactivated derivatives, IS30 family [Butyrivibrio fibrisolvens DSM 3071]|uniref:Transposase and inactivated derivatives, IS30 family n=2 Tax=Butyrivibrio fibrisolvens TaxID=831 RepID=A0A1M6DTT8_BUTFI|nr:Transposase and inactivated derivatives, IS30 family [Butyrivibrio fibrisolvens DSM 3071]SHI76666.1 Transposase and inactivated derivatives, IS30 family [Butyrivibrio fibrisolvens DSM 3071]